MTVFESLNETTTKATNTAEKYIDTSKDYLKLKVFQQLTLTLSLAVKSAIIGGLIAFALIFISISGALALGDKLDNLPLGFLLVGLIFVILSIIVFIFRERVNSKIISTVSEKFFDK